VGRQRSGLGGRQGDAVLAVPELREQAGETLFLARVFDGASRAGFPVLAIANVIYFIQSDQRGYCRFFISTVRLLGLQFRHLGAL